MGLFLLYYQTGTLQISELYEACQGKNVYAAALCLLVGFGAKAGAFPLHIWLPKAHPVAPAPASALLSGILTKTGIFGILVISCQILFHDELWGTFILMIGVITMFLGALLAVFSIDFKRTLACSSVSQIGFILVGVGMQGLLAEENALAVRGTFLHMVNHSVFKLVLFMTAGVIYMNVHKLNLNEIRGFGKKKPLLAGIYLMGALGIAILAKKSKIRKKFSFDINVKDFETKEITCNKCPNHCEIITVRQDKKLIDSWGNRCPNGEIKVKN